MRRLLKARGKAEGFSLIEVMFAMVILGIGLVALMAMFARAVYAVQYSREDQIAKQKAQEALESVYSARNDASLDWDSIQNVKDGGVFKDGFQKLYLAGDNGLVGTGQDSTTLDRVILPGPDGKLGTSDDRVIPLVNFERQIAIGKVYHDDGSVNEDLRKIAVTVRVESAGRPIKDYTVSGYISAFR